MGKVRPNKRYQDCAVCGKTVKPNEGYLVRSDRAQDMGRWIVYHPECAPEYLRDQALQSQRKALTAEGNLFHPYDEEAVKKIRALPGAWWNAENHWWVVSLEPHDRERILSTARELGLEIAPELLEDTTSEVTLEIASRADSLNTSEAIAEAAKWLGIRQKGILNLPHQDAVTAAVVALRQDQPAIIVANSDDCQSWAHALGTLRPKIRVHHREKGSDRWWWPMACEVVITTPGRLPPDFEPRVIGVDEQGKEFKSVNFSPASRQLASECDFILDGLDYITNYQTYQSQRITGLIGQVKNKWYIGDLPADPQKLWDALTVMHLARETFRSFKNFKRCFSGQAGRWGKMEWGAVLDEAHDRLANVCFARPNLR